MIHSRQNHPYLNKSSKLFLGDTLVCLGLAISNTVWSLYIKSFGLSNSQVGLFSAFLVAVALVASLFAIPLIEKYRKRMLLIISSLAAIVLYTVIAIANNFWIFAIAACCLTVASIFRITSFGILFKSLVKPESFEKNEGLLYALDNAGWLIGPLVAGFFLLKLPLHFLFFITALFFLMAMLSYKSLPKIKIKKERVLFDKDYLKILKDYLYHKKLRYSYVASCGLSVWWSLIYIYMPLFAYEKGIAEHEIAFILALLVIPLVTLEYKIGTLSKKYGVNPFIRTGFIGLIIIALALFFIENIYYQFVLIILASVFTAMLEPTLEILFFKQTTRREEEKFYSLYLTAFNVGSLITKVFIAVLLFTLPDSYAFLAAAGLMSLSLIASFKIKE